MLNVCDTVNQSERIEIVNDYTCKLFRSGYVKSQAREIVTSGLVGYKRKVNRAAKEDLPLHRPAASTLSGRVAKKLTERESWYKEER